MTPNVKNVPAPAATGVEDNEQFSNLTPVRVYLPRRDDDTRLAELDRLEEGL